METPVDPFFMTKGGSMLQALNSFPVDTFQPNVSDPNIMFLPPSMSLPPIMMTLPPEQPNTIIVSETKQTKLLTPKNIMIGTAILCAFILFTKKK